MDTFQPIGKASTLKEALAIFQELGDKLRRGMYFCMRDPNPPLWENYLNIRGGSYSLRGGPETGVEYFKTYCVGAMMEDAVVDKSDTIVGISISPKIMNNQNGTSKVGFYVIKVWNKDCEKFNKPAGLNLLHSGLVAQDILYTPHVDKKM
jgi:Eukaryotic initiation factor 4E